MTHEIPEKTAGRTIRSFIRRQGRITPAQKSALEELWDEFCLDPNAAFDPAAVFGRCAQIILEIGFGNGESLSETASSHLENDYLGIEVHKPGVGHLMLKLKELGLTNVRIYCADAVDILERRIADGSLEGINLFFPDPWPKKKHRKRRIVTPEFIALAVSKLKPGGFFHATTDWEDYARQMLAVVEACGALENTAGPSAFAPRPGDRPLTKFEKRGLRLGHGVWDLIYRRR